MHELGVLSAEEVATLIPFAQTPRQKEILTAIVERGTQVAAAEALKVNKRSVERCVERVKVVAAQKGWSPDHDMTKAVPDPFHIDGVSTFYRRDDETGEMVMRNQWVKSKKDSDQTQNLVDAVTDIFSKDMIVPEIARSTKHSDDDLLAVYPMGDPHIGMYSWAKETGDDFDVNIAKRNLVDATERLVQSAPEARTALIVNVGDFFHSDSQDNRTARSGHALDVDTRWTNVLEVGILAMRQCIEAALRKHERVHVINAIGNHDDHTAQVLTISLRIAYENNPRVTFGEPQLPFHYYRFGKVLLGVTHGDKAKKEQLAMVMAADRHEDWGETLFRYWLTGHIHTHNVFEFPGCHVESFRTLAGKDAWHAAMGYRSGRDMYCIVHHREYGEIERHRKDILMLDKS